MARRSRIESAYLESHEFARVRGEIVGTYAQAEAELTKKLDRFAKMFAAQDREKRAQIASGQITKQQYESWLRGQVFRGDRWKAVRQSCVDQIHRANETTARMLNGERRAIFQRGANYSAYQIERSTKGAVDFTLYDSATVTRLIKEQPKMLPDLKVGKRRDESWNGRGIQNAITQGIVQGESIPDIAKRIAHQTGERNRAALTRQARTAMTGAQNAGRIQAMHDAEDMGIKVKKKWIATLDKKTRDAHAELDGQVVDADKPFVVNGMEIMYPGDPNADPSLVYNCRCTLGWEYPDYPSAPGARRDNETGEVIGGVTYQQWEANKTTPEVEEASSHKWSREEYMAAKAAKDETYRLAKREAEEWYTAELDRIIDAKYGGDFIEQRIAIRRDETLTEEEKEKRLEEVDRKREAFATERDKVAEMRNAMIQKAADARDYTFDPDYEYRRIEENLSLAQQARMVNPHYWDTSLDYAYTINCQRCALSFEMRMRGYDTQAMPAPNGGLGAEAKFVWQFGKPEFDEAANGVASIESVRDTMRQWGDGSRAIVCIDRYNGEDGHAFNAVYQNGVLSIIDPQSGTLADDRDGLENMREYYISASSTSRVKLYRTDGKKLKHIDADWVRAN